MFPNTRFISRRIVLSPQGPLVAGGAAEGFEQQLRQLLRTGHLNLVIDLSAVPTIDSAGISALVRCHTTVQRAGGSLRLAASSPAVSRILEVAHLDGVFASYESIEAAQMAAWPWRTIATTLSGALLCGLLVWFEYRWPAGLMVEGAGAAQGAPPVALGEATTAIVPQVRPFLEVVKLIAALLIGALVTRVHRPASRDRLVARSMAHAQMLLCVAGALMMIVIGSSLARAFGVVGAASIIRFRTPVDDPKDVTVLFILMGLGMATGLGAFAVAGLGAGFLCISLLVLERIDRQEARLMSVEVVAAGRHLPSKEIEEVFARNQIAFEPREITQGDEVTVKYHTWLAPGTSIEDLSQQMRDIPGVTEVGWEPPKRI
jgi:anti-anti-sigma factor